MLTLCLDDSLLTDYVAMLTEQTTTGCKSYLLAVH